MNKKQIKIFFIGGFIFLILGGIALFIFSVIDSKTQEEFNEENSNIENDSDDDMNVTLSNGLIPIIYNGSNWLVADTSSVWYNYDNQQWANAISVTESSRSSYTIGKVVSEADVLGYYVYIPRYKYEVFNTGSISQTGNEQTINIEFENSTDAKATGTTVGSWLTHPAFTLGDVELSGIWVGKFEVTGTIDEITIKPNEVSLREESVSSFYNAIYSMSDDGNVYGLSTSSDAHMMKNTEWGAVAYLSHSKYGINTEITINNNSENITGCGAAAVIALSSSECAIEYGSSATKQPQSTTGNITGIYDMSGGTEEYVMGLYDETIGAAEFIESFFTMGSNYKYYNNYEGGISNIILGDAIAETNCWYLDNTLFINEYSPWITRGGAYNGTTLAGIFGYSYNVGSANSSVSTRVVVLP